MIAVCPSSMSNRIDSNRIDSNNIDRGVSRRGRKAIPSDLLFFLARQPTGYPKPALRASARPKFVIS
jgi:hypothetical protein